MALYLPRKRAGSKGPRETVPVIVITFLLKRRPDVAPDEFHRYWRDVHGPLVTSHADALGIRRYLQLHATETASGRLAAASRSAAPGDWDGVALVWFDSEEALGAAVATPAGQAAAAALLEDEQRFIDLPSCQLFTSEDVAFVA
jgi:uncharacterized protein (TIGR02118 family)